MKRGGGRRRQRRSHLKTNFQFPATVPTAKRPISVSQRTIRPTSNRMCRALFCDMSRSLLANVGINYPCQFQNEFGKREGVCESIKRDVLRHNYDEEGEGGAHRSFTD